MSNTLSSHHTDDHEIPPLMETIAATDHGATGLDKEKTVKELTIEALRTLEEGLTRIASLEDVEEAAYEIMDSLPESKQLLAQIDAARKDRNTLLEATLIERQRRIFEDVRDELALIAGIETNEHRIEQENAEYRTRLTDLLGESTMEDVETGAILERMGMLRVDEESGKQVFTYPKGAFPPHIDDKWEHYKDLVAQHVRAITERNRGISNDATMIAQLDAVRKTAHNNLSIAIKDFLQLDSWNLEKCRRLVIKMRDAMFPTVETAEKEVTAQEVLRLIQTIKTLHTQ